MRVITCGRGVYLGVGALRAAPGAASAPATDERLLLDVLHLDLLFGVIGEQGVGETGEAGGLRVTSGPRDARAVGVAMVREARGVGQCDAVCRYRTLALVADGEHFHR